MGWHITDAAKLEKAILDLKLDLVQKIGVQQDMTIVDVGCGQGGFTAALARTVGKRGKVFAVDISNEYLDEFSERINKHGVKIIVAFVQTDAANLKSAMSAEAIDMVVSYRLLEELEQPETMPQVIGQMAQTCKKSGRICLIELNTETRNEAEENYVRLHRESGDCFFEHNQIISAMENSGLFDIRMENFETHIWFSPDLAKQELSHTQVWYDVDVEKRLGQLIDKYGMKYPALIIFSGVKRH
jgi:ubiquinone/menaquinone biosynthesis C-methylase UbiE